MSISSSAPPKPASEPRAENRAPNNDPRLREAFERALTQRSRTGADDDAAPDQGTAEQRLAGPELAAWLRAEAPLPLEPAAPVFASSQPVVQAPDAGAAAGAEAAAGGRADAIASSTLRAALSGLQVPASTEGLQHFQFSFSHHGAPLSGVSLTARPDAPWQLQLQLPAHARERPALDAKLGELRQRLNGRGAQVGEIELRDPHDPV